MQRQQSMLWSTQKSRVRGFQWTFQRDAGQEIPHLESIWAARETKLILTLNVGRIGLGDRDPAITDNAGGHPPHSQKRMTETRRITALITARIDATTMTKIETLKDADHPQVDLIRGQNLITVTLKPHPPPTTSSP